MKDELEEMSDASSQKTVTDWLMHVISGKQPETRPRATTPEAEQPEPAEKASSAEIPQSTNGAKSNGFASLFTAADLCGAPMIPIVPEMEEEEAPSAEEITADDVCWVPEDRRLKPQEPIVISAAPTQDSVQTAPYIVREPVPYVEQRDVVQEAEAREITAADISRQWVIDEMEAAAERERAAAAAEPVVPEIEIAAEPQAEAASIVEAQVIQHEPETAPAEAGMVEAAIEPVIPEPAVEPEMAGAEVYEMHEPIAAESNHDHSAQKVWAKEGYWETEVPSIQPTERLPVDVQGEVEIQHRDAAPATARGYFGSVLGPEEVAEIEKAKPEGWSAAWRTMIRLGSALPWLSRALPALEAGLGNQQETAAASGASMPQEVQQDMAGLRLVQYEIRTTVQDHSTQLKRMEDQLSRVREAVDSKSSDDAELTASVNAAMRKLRIVGLGLGSLLLVLITLAMMLLLRK